jgi:hypothetical protein
MLKSLLLALLEVVATLLLVSRIAPPSKVENNTAKGTVLNQAAGLNQAAALNATCRSWLTDQNCKDSSFPLCKQALDEALEADPTFWPARANLAKIKYLNAKRTLGTDSYGQLTSLIYADQALSLNPSLQEAWRAERDIVVAMEMRPDSPEDRTKLADMIAWPNESPVAAIFEYEQALARRQNPLIHKKVADLYRDLGRFKEAANHYAVSAALSWEASHSKTAYALENEGQLKPARDLYLELIEHGIEGGIAYRKALVRCCRKIATGEPTAANYYQLSRAQLIDCDLESAQLSARRAKKLPRSREFFDVDYALRDGQEYTAEYRKKHLAQNTHFAWANRLSTKRSFEKAMKEYRLALDWDENLWSARVLGQVPPEPFSMLPVAGMGAPSDPLGFDRIDELDATPPDESEILLHLARALQANGKWREALRVCTLILDSRNFLYTSLDEDPQESDLEDSTIKEADALAINLIGQLETQVVGPTPSPEYIGRLAKELPFTPRNFFELSALDLAQRWGDCPSPYVPDVRAALLSLVANHYISSGEPCTVNDHDPQAAWRKLVLLSLQADSKTQNWYLEQALAQARKLPKPDLRLAVTLSALASNDLSDSDAIKGNLLTEAVQLCAQIDPQPESFLATFQFNLGCAYYRSAGSDLALEQFKSALGHFENLKELQAQADTNFSVGCACVDLDKYADASQAYFRAAQINEKLGERSGYLTSLRSAAKAASKVVNSDAADSLNAAILSNDSKSRDSYYLLEDLTRIVKVKIQQKKLQEAKEYLQAASPYYQKCCRQCSGDAFCSGGWQRSGFQSISYNQDDYLEKRLCRREERISPPLKFENTCPLSDYRDECRFFEGKGISIK